MDPEERRLFSRDCYVSLGGSSGAGRVEITPRRLLIQKLSMQIFGIRPPRWETVLDVDINDDITCTKGRKRSIFIRADGKELTLADRNVSSEFFSEEIRRNLLLSREINGNPMHFS